MMNGCDCYGEKTLHYVSAAHGGWGIVRIAAQVPESHQLFVCPFACGRHGALGGEMNGIKDRISYLFITEADIVSGEFEELIVDGVNELFEALEKQPKVLFVFTACLDDLLGTDHEPILKRLGELYPDTHFRHCTMNPISLDTTLPPGITVQINMYSLLEPASEQKKQVNLLGCNVPQKETDDIRAVLQQAGYELGVLSACRDYEEFEEMAKAELNLVISPVVLAAAKKMEKKLGIPWLRHLRSYRLDEIDEMYAALSKQLNTDLTEAAAEFRKKAEEKITETLAVIGDYPVAVDYQAVLRPFNLALALTEYGFKVGLVASNGIPAFEKESAKKLKEMVPDIVFTDPMHPQSVQYPHEGEEYLCIGFDCGYITKSKKLVELVEDEGLFGYSGVMELMNRMQDAFLTKADVNKMIEGAGLII